MRLGITGLEAAIADQYLSSSEFSGSRMFFSQAAAPNGWTKDTTYDDCGLRVTNGTTSSGGSVNFSSMMTTQTLSGTASLSGTALGPTTLSTSNLPYHTHSYNWVGSTSAGDTLQPSAKVYIKPPTQNTVNTFASSPTSTAWTGGSHTHTISPGTAPAGVSFNMAIQYLDVIIATKN
jgi:hypothetical protein